MFLIRCFLLVVLLAGCGQGEDNPFYPDPPGEFCDGHGGVSFIEYDVVYCEDGSFWEFE